MLMRLFIALAVLLTFSGCASLQPPVFSTETEVLAQRGKPTRIWENEDGSRTLEYATQPNGYTCWMYIVDFDGLVLSQFDALSDVNRQRVKAGMTPDQVRRLLGEQRTIQYFPNSKEEVWDWNIRNEYPDLLATRFNVHFVGGVVNRTSISYEYPRGGMLIGFGRGGWGPGYWGPGYWGPGWGRMGWWGGPGYWW